MAIKECRNKCPKCGTDIYNTEWDDLEVIKLCHLRVTCPECGCKFEEIYEYKHTKYKKMG